MTAKESYAEYLQTDYWKQVSAAVKARAGHRCQVCNDSKNLTAHHRTYAHKGSEMEHLDDLVCLCWPCHSLFHEKSDIHREPREKRARKPRKTKGNILDFPAAPDSIVITKETLKPLRNKFGQVPAKALEILGIDPSRKWAKKIIGTSISKALLEAAYIASDTKVFTHYAPASYLSDHLDQQPTTESTPCIIPPTSPP